MQPVISFDKKDDRIVEGRDVLADFQDKQNLAEIDWVDFEHLVRQLFEREFSNAGAEVKITRSSRDRGVDAIVFDPDPVRGGKIVIQAKRYTLAVDVAAVRELYGTVQNETANKGILCHDQPFWSQCLRICKGQKSYLDRWPKSFGTISEAWIRFPDQPRGGSAQSSLGPKAPRRFKMGHRGTPSHMASAPENTLSTAASLAGHRDDQRLSARLVQFKPIGAMGFRPEDFNLILRRRHFTRR